ncbi:MAG: phosphoesterase [bacterium]|nr:phosphoesterase [bacterium]
MEPLRFYDELYAVSDLHLGGSAGFQVFNQGELLGRLIDHLRRRTPDGRLALVLNGDTIDFLAESEPETRSIYFDPRGAVRKLERIARDPAFAPVFQALRRFVRTPRRELIVTLGNHDLELALPWVRERFLDLLAGGRESARGRIHLAFDGSGFPASVGGRTVLCVHGNEVDTWNVADYETIRRIGCDLTRDRDVEPWTPNAGTKLVVDVMNEVKAEWPFIDLLKPGDEGAVPILLALDPGQAGKIKRVLRVAARLTWDQIRVSTGLLSADEAPAEEPEADPDAALEATLRRTFGRADSFDKDADDLLERMEDRLKSEVDPMTLVSGDRREEYLGYFGAALNLIRGRPTPEVLREALSGLKEDPSFDLDHKDDTFQRLDELIGPDVDYVVTGHTHLERDLTRRGGGHYFNSGTWIRLIRLEEEVLSDQERFDEVCKVLKKGSMEALDAELVLLRPTVVSIRAEANAVVAGLERVQEDTGGGVELVPVKAQVGEGP